MLVDSPSHTRGQDSGEVDLGNRGDLEVCLTSGPDRRSVSSHHRSSKRTNATIGVGVGVRGHRNSARPGISLLNHDLMANTTAGAIEGNAVMAGELLDQSVFLQVGLALVLNIVIQRQYDLLGVVNFGGADRGELGHYGKGVVVGHTLSTMSATLRALFALY